KHDIYPEQQRPELVVPSTCEDAGRAALGAAFTSLEGTAIDATAAMVAARAAPGSPLLYYPQDTHWTQHGAVVAIRELIGSFGGGLWNDADVVLSGTKSRVMDSALLMGVRHVVRTPKVVIRPEVEQHRTDILEAGQAGNSRTIFRITCTGSAPLLPG